MDLKERWRDRVQRLALIEQRALSINSLLNTPLSADDFAPQSGDADQPMKGDDKQIEAKLLPVNSANTPIMNTKTYENAENHLF